MCPTGSTDKGANSSLPLGRLYIKTNGIARVDWAIHAAMILAFPVVVLFVVYLSGTQPPTDVLPKVVGVAILLTLLDLLIEELVSTRAITLTASGVTFRYPFHSEYRQWSDLEPSQSPAQSGSWYVTSRRTLGHRSSARAFRLTIEQARAMLDYPACPKWTLPPTVTSSLGAHALA